MATDLTTEVLDALSRTEEPVLSTDAFPSTPSTEIKSALDRLKSRDMISYEAIDKDEAILTPEAEGIAANGSHEAKVFEAVLQAVEGMKMSDLPVRWLNCMPGRLDVRCMLHAELYHRRLSAKRAQRSGRVKLSKRAGSRRTRTF